MQQLIRTLLAAVVLLAFSVTSQAEVTVTYLHTDALGSVVAASDEDGDLLWRKAYMPYGAIHENGQAKNPAVGYTGHVQDDDTGLTYMGARYYDPALGRFLQMDPASVLGHVESNPMMFNRYAYANGNPYKFIDPDGEAPRRNRDGDAGAALGGLILVLTGVWTEKQYYLSQGIELPEAKGGSKAKKNRAKSVTKSGPPRNPDGRFAKVDGPTAGKKVDTATRQRILKRDQNPDGSWTCATCGHSTKNPANIHTGHIKARSQGGDLSDGNLRCEGAACNLSQGAGSSPKAERTCAARGSCGAPYGRTD